MVGLANNKEGIGFIVERVKRYLEELNVVELKNLLNSLSLEEIEEVLAALPPDERGLVFRILPKDKAEKLFTRLSEYAQNNIISKMRNIAKIFEDLPLSQVADIIDELPPSLAVSLLKGIPKEERKSVIKILGYEEGTAGRLITPYFIKVNINDTVGKALRKVRENASEIDNLSYLYVVNEEGKFIGVVELKDLLTNSPKRRIKNLVKPFPYVFAKEDQEVAVRKMLEEDVIELPVVDSEMKLIGVIPSDELLEVAEEEASEDIEMLGGISRSEEYSYFYSDLKERLVSRLPWLVVLLLAALSSATIISIYKESLERAIILAAFIPMILGTGGNTASQVVALVVRGLATGEVTKENAITILKEELKTIFSLAVLLGTLGFFISFFESNLAIISLIVSLSIFSVVIAANLVAFIFPFILKRIGIDPAVASGPLVTTIIDSLGLLIFFNVANLVLTYFNF